MMCCKPMNVILSAICTGMIAFGAMGASAAEPCDGFRPLLNGKDLTGWTDEQGKAPGAGWVIEDGVLVRKGEAGNLWTKERFGDFVLDMEFKAHANSGILLRCDKPTDYVQTCIEIQVLPPGNKPHKHSCGAFYDCVAPSKEMCKAGEWNHVVITAKDNELTVVLKCAQSREVRASNMAPTLSISRSISPGFRFALAPKTRCSMK